MAHVTALYRYPVKGLSAEPLPALGLSRAAGLAHDREYALALGTTAFDPQAPEPLDKGYFLMLRGNAPLAALATRFEPETGRLTIVQGGQDVLCEDLSTETGREAVERFFESYIARPPRGAPGWCGPTGTSSPTAA